MKAFLVLIAALGLVLVSAQETVVHSANCYLTPPLTTYDSSVSGLVTFERNVNGIDYGWDITGLSDGSHAMEFRTYGDLLASDGSTLGPIYQSEFNRVITSSGGRATGSVSGDISFRLNGIGSVVGRSVVVWGLVNNTQAIALTCVVGRTDGPAVESEMNTDFDRYPTIRRATCVFRNTTVGGAVGQSSGWVDFEQTTPGGNVTVEYFVQNILRGSVVYHSSHIHWAGDLTAQNTANQTLGHYNNTFFLVSPNGRGPRPSGLQEVGAIGNTYNFTSDYADTLSAQFSDNIISLKGMSSIVGRSVVIHGIVGNTATRIAQCVIGLKTDGEGSVPVPAISTTGNGPAAPLTVNQTTRASCYFKPTADGNAKLTGMVQFESQATTGYVSVRYHIGGLSRGRHSWHVHEFGALGTLPDGQNTGAATGAHFVGTVNPPRTGDLQEVGAIDNDRGIWADGTGYARGYFVDNQIRLNGPNGIVGRSLIIHGTTASVRVGQCVIGKRAETAVYDADVGYPAPITRATAHVSYTSLSGNLVLLGTVEFFQGDPNGEVTVQYNFVSLPYVNADYPWHVHKLGDLLAWDNVGSVQGHFIGQNPFRPSPALQEVGLLNNGVPLHSDANGASVGQFNDNQIKLSGINSIIGRAIVVHASPSNTNRIAWGVIGIQQGSASLASPTLWLFVLIAMVATMAGSW